MSAVHKRKTKSNELSYGDDPSLDKKYNKRGAPFLGRKYTALYLLAIILVLLVGVYTSLLFPILNNVASTLGYKDPVYAVIIDAGSTGSRVLAYTFHRSYFGGQLNLYDELFHEIKPGLSSFVDNPDKGGETINQLLHHAYSVVPVENRAVTPVILRATAGLRLLSAGAAEKLLEASRRALGNSGFRVNRRDAVEIMDGRDEGINSWFTVNFLQDKLNTKTSAALDLGGGSTQVTYEPNTHLPTPLVSIDGPQKNISLFTHSFLNLGLMAARYGVLMEERSGNGTHMTSECINPVIKNVHWRYANKDHYVSGPQKNIAYRQQKENVINISERVPIVRMEKCRDLLSRLVAKQLEGAPEPLYLDRQHINAFSYYWDRATDVGLIDPAKGGIVKVKDFIEASKLECGTPNVDQPWICLDLTFISVLLQEAFHLKPNKEIELIKKINGHEISWALGLAYNTLIRH